jgi:hypothetical protein
MPSGPSSFQNYAYPAFRSCPPGIWRMTIWRVLLDAAMGLVASATMQVLAMIHNPAAEGVWNGMA